MNHATVRDVAAAGCFLAFVAGAAYTGWRIRDVASRKHRASLFAVWTLGISLGVGVTQRDMYPFTSWPLMVWMYPDQLPLRRALVVDAAGAEHAIDYRAWHPFAPDEIISWLGQNFMQLDSATRDDVARDLLQRANQGAERVRAGESLGTYGRLLGPLHAPQFHLHPEPWRSPEDVREAPYSGFRLIVELLDPDRAAAGRPLARHTLYEYRERR